MAQVFRELLQVYSQVLVSDTAGLGFCSPSIGISFFQPTVLTPDQLQHQGMKWPTGISSLAQTIFSNAELGVMARQLQAILQ